MGKFYILDQKKCEAKAKTIRFLLDFSKSIEVIGSSNKKLLIFKN